MRWLIIGGTLISMLVVSSGVRADVRVENAFPALSFDRPVDIQQPADSNALFVVEQHGVIHALREQNGSYSLSVYLDISGQIDDAGNEEGLLGLAFHPRFMENGYFYVNYTAADPPRTVISRFRRSRSDTDAAEPGSEVVILETAQPYDNHNGGGMQFGPDGMLYISFGDGGSGGDPQHNGQNPATLLGTIIRIDVDNPAEGMAYGIPDDNPFAGNDNGYREEIYAYGLRNPWRFSFDRQTGDLWTGDVGQNEWEEIDIITSGANYGWNVMEGEVCYQSGDCDTEGLTMPVHVYGHDAGRSITGGYVYRGSQVPELTGLYVFADFVSGRIWTLDRHDEDGPTVELLMDTDLNISSFGEDADGELYLCSFDGMVYRFRSDATGVKHGHSPLPGILIIESNYPNPFNESTTIPFHLTEPEQVKLSLLDSAGQQVCVLIEGSMQAGRHQVRWDGLNENGVPVGSGLFHYLFSTPSQTAMGRMLLVK